MISTTDNAIIGSNFCQEAQVEHASSVELKTQKTHLHSHQFTFHRKCLEINLSQQSLLLVVNTQFTIHSSDVWRSWGLLFREIVKFAFVSTQFGPSLNVLLDKHRYLHSLISRILTEEINKRRSIRCDQWLTGYWLVILCYWSAGIDPRYLVRINDH